MLNGFLLRGCSVFGVLQDRGPKDEYDHDACSAFHFGTSQDAAVIPDRPKCFDPQRFSRALLPSSPLCWQQH
jgi:hypothetical protein